MPMNNSAAQPPHTPQQIEVTVAAATAVCNRVFIVQADRSGRERGIDWDEASVIVDPDGRLLAGSRARHRLLVADLELDLARAKTIGARNDVLADRRPSCTVGRDDRRSARPPRRRPRAVICAEGYLFEFERRGYLQAGAFVPEIVLEHPDLVAGLHREFVHAGSDVVEAFTYYGHREKLRVIGKEELLEPLNRNALAIAAAVARDTDTLLAGNICNTNVFAPDAESRRVVRAVFDEQVAWIAEAGVDFVVGETFSYAEEAEIALESILAAGLVAVITLSVHRAPETREGLSPADACARLEQAGADVVGLNCTRGPATMLPLIETIRARVGGHVAALPVPYRTTPEEPSFQSLTDPGVRLHPGRPAVSHRARPVPLQPPRDRRVRARRERDRRPLPRRLLRRRAAHDPQHG